MPTVNGAGRYALTVTNIYNLCEDRDTVTVGVIGQTPAQLPADYAICGDTTSVRANLPAGATGQWTIINGNNATISTQETLANISNLTGVVSLAWTLSAPGCLNYSTDSIQITQTQAPLAFDDLLLIEGNDGFGRINLLANDQRSGPVTVRLLDTVPFGTLTFLNGDLSFDAGIGASGSFTLRYELCSNSCALCDEAELTIRVDGSGQRPPVYNAITPNGDGLNETLVFDLLNVQPDDFPNNELIVFNRWGDILYTAKPYQNNWDGLNQSGEPIPEGTYYYILRLSLGEGDIIRGDVTIIR
ncbi:MAG: gliding motility-associated C-terminal domain-containing protein [Lewinella sp.]|nr:gliding motility-associated C-terminal domain-containing protein [Lewinella sp.]